MFLLKASKHVLSAHFVLLPPPTTTTTTLSSFKASCLVLGGGGVGGEPIKASGEGGGELGTRFRRFPSNQELNEELM